MSAAKPQQVPTTAEADLPEGWALCSLGDITTHPQYGWTTSADKNGGGLKLLRTTDISDGIVEWNSVPSCRVEPDDPDKYLLERGDLLVSRAGSVGISYLVKEAPRAVFASYLIRFRALPPISGEFISIFMKSPAYWSAIADESAGIAIPNVNASKLKQIELPLPPLAEQKRIVAKVEELLARVNAARDRLARVPAILKRFRQAVLAAACSGRLTAAWRLGNGNSNGARSLLQEILRDRPKRVVAQGVSKADIPREPNEAHVIDAPEQWAITSLDQLSCLVTSGSRGWAKYYSESGPMFIRAQDINTDKLGLDDVARVQPPDGAEGRRTRVQAFDLLVTITGANVTKSAMVPCDISEAYVSQHVALVRPVDTATATFLFLWIVSPEHGRAKLLADAYGAGKPGLNLDNIKEVRVALPPLAEQREIVRRVEALFRLADAIERRVAGATARADKLTQAILAKALRGQLVATEAELARRESRPYEPASALLARIRNNSADVQRSSVRPQKKSTRKEA
ncbi:MAG: restriction endonuclease subunit S [Acidobacteriales bacterium]|nr:restriction endonuclease subunit S [Terriglobales bacterium]